MLKSLASNCRFAQFRVVSECSRRHNVIYTLIRNTLYIYMPIDVPKREGQATRCGNGTAERWVECCRRDLIDHVIVLNEQLLKRLLSEYVRYYHED